MSSSITARTNRASSFHQNGPTIPKPSGNIAHTTAVTAKGPPPPPVDLQSLKKANERVSYQTCFVHSVQRRLTPLYLLQNTKRARNSRPSHALLNTFILSLLAISFVSLSFCPSPEQIDKSVARSYFNLNNLNPFTSSDPGVPAWERHICQPTTAYRRHILEPYVVPHVQRRVAQIQAHPIVKEHIAPAYHQVEVKTRNQRKAVYYRTQRVYNRAVRPYVPHFHAATKRLISRAEFAGNQAWQQILALLAQVQALVSPYLEHPHVIRARKTANDLYNHPTVATAGKHANLVYKRSVPHFEKLGVYGGQKSSQSYAWARKTGIPQVAKGAVNALDVAENNLKQIVL